MWFRAAQYFLEAGSSGPSSRAVQLHPAPGCPAEGIRGANIELPLFLLTCVLCYYPVCPGEGAPVYNCMSRLGGLAEAWSTPVLMAQVGLYSSSRLNFCVCACVCTAHNITFENSDQTLRCLILPSVIWPFQNFRCNIHGKFLHILLPHPQLMIIHYHWVFIILLSFSLNFVYVFIFSSLHSCSVYFMRIFDFLYVLLQNLGCHFVCQSLYFRNCIVLWISFLFSFTRHLILIFFHSAWCF